MDEDGYITHLGRDDDLMNAQGYRVSPLEVEQALGEHPDVTEVAVTEIQVAENISVIGAFVVLREDAEKDQQSLLDFVKTRLATYKVPREFIFVDKLPRTPNGKVKRAELRSSYNA
jgi:acetyl-CoA synthetase